MVALHKIADHQLKELPSYGKFKLKEEEEEEEEDDDDEYCWRRWRVPYKLVAQLDF